MKTLILIAALGLAACEAPNTPSRGVQEFKLGTPCGDGYATLARGEEVLSESYELGMTSDDPLVKSVQEGQIEMQNILAKVCGTMI